MKLEAEPRILASTAGAGGRLDGGGGGVDSATARAVEGASPVRAVPGGPSPGLVEPPDAQKAPANEEAIGNCGRRQIDHGARATS
jgi:hypothetical protein